MLKYRSRAECLGASLRVKRPLAALWMAVLGSACSTPPDSGGTGVPASTASSRTASSTAGSPALPSTAEALATPDAGPMGRYPVDSDMILLGWQDEELVLARLRRSDDNCGAVREFGPGCFAIEGSSGRVFAKSCELGTLDAFIAEHSDLLDSLTPLEPPRRLPSEYIVAPAVHFDAPEMPTLVGIAPDHVVEIRLLPASGERPIEAIAVGSACAFRSDMEPPVRPAGILKRKALFSSPGGVTAVSVWKVGTSEPRSRSFVLAVDVRDAPLLKTPDIRLLVEDALYYGRVDTLLDKSSSVAPTPGRVWGGTRALAEALLHETPPANEVPKDQDLRLSWTLKIAALNPWSEDALFEAARSKARYKPSPYDPLDHVAALVDLNTDKARGHLRRVACHSDFAGVRSMLIEKLPEAGLEEISCKSDDERIEPPPSVLLSMHAAASPERAREVANRLLKAGNSPRRVASAVFRSVLSEHGPLHYWTAFSDGREKWLELAVAIDPTFELARYGAARALLRVRDGFRAEYKGAVEQLEALRELGTSRARTLMTEDFRDEDDFRVIRSPDGELKLPDWIEE